VTFEQALLYVAFVAGSVPVHAQTFSSKVEAVRVDVLVTDGRRPVNGLTAADFEVLDNGVRQQVDLVFFEQLPINVVLALDMSGSVSGERLDHLQRAASALLGGLKPHDRAGLVTFSHEVVQQTPLTTNVDQVRRALGGSEAQGGTALVDGAYAGMMLGESDAGRSLMVIFSDGLDTSSWLTAESILDISKRCDVVIYSVATGGSRRSEFLRDLSSGSGGRLFEVESTRNLESAFVAILEEFRHRYLVTYSPRDVGRGGWHKLEVRVPRRGVTVKARPGYLGGS
jgi:Ca-activated chloride channel family protein